MRNLVSDIMDLLALCDGEANLAEFSALKESIEQLERILGGNCGSEEPISLDVVFKIEGKSLFKNLLDIKLLGFPGRTFHLSSGHFHRQSFNLCFHARRISFLTSGNVFAILPETKIRILFLPENYLVANLRPICSEYFFDNYLTANFKGFFKNNVVEFTDIREYNDRNYVPQIKGMILKKGKMKDCVILTLLDLRDFLNTFKVYVNFRFFEEIDRFDGEVKPGDIITFRDNIKKTIVKKLNIVYAVQYHRNTKIELIQQTKYQFRNFKARRRIEKNVKNIEYPLAELVNLQPHVFHRSLLRMIARLVKILYVEIKLFCRKCLKKANLCVCAEPSLDQIDFFCSTIMQNSGLTFCASLKGHESFVTFFEITSGELDFIIDYLRNFGDIKHTFGAHIDFKSKFAVVLAILEKQIGDKIIWGKLGSRLKELESEEKTFFVNFLKVRNSILYPNGIVKQNVQRGQMSFVFDFKVKHVEEDEQLVTKMKFKHLLGKILI